jgi:hypothetical protein
VKIRGQRVELGEIESVLDAHPQVSACTVSLVELPGDERLVAWVVGEGELSVEDLRVWLSDRLPAAMLPQAYERVAGLPRLANGKVDRTQLPAPTWGRDREQALVPPRTELEGVLRDIWQDVLELAEVGVHDDFFALGGHSLLATRLIARVRDHLDLEVPLFSIFEYPTIEGMARVIVDCEQQSPAPGITLLSREDRKIVTSPDDSQGQK